ncbi:uncharacterized protein LOC34621650 [Cyclospora cayetanensis]|uniref:Uncharacterized protein LOC34621650 n=1 Tax=Cyclospora cayetanensis TaxID=88456 RepID=A0A6P6RW90_9EIME|nr:uncharacterized protein LOC34621650 [Cyclospora cayetanensis]
MESVGRPPEERREEGPPTVLPAERVGSAEATRAIPAENPTETCEAFVRLAGEEAALFDGTVAEALRKWGLFDSLSVGCFFCCYPPKGTAAAALISQLFLSPAFQAFAAEKGLEAFSEKGHMHAAAEES